MNNMCVVVEHHIIKVKERCRVCGRFLMEAREKKTKKQGAPRVRNPSTHY